MADVWGSLRRAGAGLRHILGALSVALISNIRHPGAGWGGLALLNRTAINYEAGVRADANSIIQACVRWAQRNYAEAPTILEEWNDGRKDWDQVYRDDLLALLERPNPYYSGDTMMRAAIADYMLDGNAYLIKVRSRSRRVVQLWWAPAMLMEPVADSRDAASFIDHYEYRPGAGAPERLAVEDVIHMRDGLDPQNTRKGLSPLKSLFREIFTDDEACNMTASLLRNAGVPGVIISPTQGTIPESAAEQIKDLYLQKFTGDRRGEPMVTAGSVHVEQFGFSPEQMGLRNLRGIPEERITAVIGINSAVLGLGAGLATTKVGATLREYREEATESFMVPLWHAVGLTFTGQLVPDFKAGDWRCIHDLAKVRVLQDDENTRAENYGKRLEAGGITVAEYRRALGMVTAPEHEVYLRKSETVAVPAGLSPEEQAGGGPAPAAGAPLDAAAAVEEAQRSIVRR
jgi:HK97 family phage portal protein